MIDQTALDTASGIALSRGLRMLQGFRLASTDAKHIAKLLRYMEPKPDTHWLDVGCGFGEPARLMMIQRPDLRFTLVNNNRFQLENVPVALDARYAEMHTLPFRGGTFDGVMFLYSLCHADSVTRALAEANRVTRPGGKLFVFDYVRINGSNTLAEEHLSSRFHTWDTIKWQCKASGWEIDGHTIPQGSDAVFRAMFENDDLYNSIFDDLRPVIWWAVAQ